MREDLMGEGSFLSLWFLRCIVDDVVDDGDDWEGWSAISAIKLLRYIYLLFSHASRSMKRAICVVGVCIVNKQIIKLRAE